MKNLNALLLSAALTGLIGGTTAAAQTSTTNPANGVTANAVNAGLHYSNNYGVAKHSCKGKNDCKGQGGCKTGDNGCKGKNSCKGKGGCKTNGTS